ncbi:MAG: response regulator transcription factor [Clostridia bacterium]|nr:response regulator transcription factor [Clostridia bacterium]
MRILVIEDNRSLNDAITEILRAEKYQVDSVYDGRDGYAYGRENIYDCIILDIMLPYLDGYEVCKQLRNERIPTPILILSAKDSIQSKVRGLDLGADDYMTKPFSTTELLARVRSLTRRKGEVILNEMSYGDLVYCKETADLSCKSSNSTVRLSYKESEIIKLFLTKPNVIISKDEIITKVWGYESDAGDSNVETYISFLRKKLSFVGSRIEIISHKKLGYRLEDKND